MIQPLEAEAIFYEMLTLKAILRSQGGELKKFLNSTNIHYSQ